MSDDKWSSSVDISGSINAVFCHDQQCQGTVNGFLGIADTVLKAVLLADLSGDSEVPVTLSWNVTRLHDYLFGIKDYEPSAGVQERSAHIEEVSGFSKGSAVSKENYTLNGEEAGKDVDDNIPGIQETESETETQTQEAAVSDNGDGSVYDDNSYDQEQYNDYSPDGYNYDEEY